jgi:hypothetical protein
VSWYLIKHRYKEISGAYSTHGKPEGKTSLARPGSRWEDNIRMDFSEVGWEGMDRMHLSQDRDHCQALVNTIMNLQVP